MSEYTKGPWEMHENPDGLPIIMKNFGDIAHVRMAIHAEGPEVIANAHLIAAAPEMYEVLKKVSDYLLKYGEIKNGSKAEEEINDILAKACPAPSTDLHTKLPTNHVDNEI